MRWGMVFVIGVVGGVAGLSTSCATTGRQRIMIGIAAGSAAGAAGGATLSPNQESRALNSLVFGLSGALLGGAIAMLSDTDSSTASAFPGLKNRELGSGGKGREFVVLPHQELPDFLKTRVQPLVIEEFVEADRVSDEGTLHEPHRAYRIKRPAELFAKPVPVVSPSPSASTAEVVR